MHSYKTETVSLYKYLRVFKLKKKRTLQEFETHLCRRRQLIEIHSGFHLKFPWLCSHLVHQDNL